MAESGGAQAPGIVSSADVALGAPSPRRLILLQRSLEAQAEATEVAPAARPTPGAHP